MDKFSAPRKNWCARRHLKSADAISECGKPLAKAPGVKFLRMEGDRVVHVKLAEEGMRRAFRSGLDCAWALHRRVGE